MPEEGRLYQAHRHTFRIQVHTFHTSSHQTCFQNTTGIELIPCSPPSKNNCSVPVNLRKQAGAIETRTGCSKKTSCLTKSFCSFPAFLRRLASARAFVPIIVVCVLAECHALTRLVPFTLTEHVSGNLYSVHLLESSTVILK